MAAIFKVTMDVEDMEGKNVLVFLLPLPPQPDYLIHPWQILTGAAGATESFEYRDMVSVYTTRSGSRQNQTASRRQALEPGELVVASNTEGSFPGLSMAPAGLAKAKLSPHQMGLINHTRPYLQMDAHWQVNGTPVVTCPNIDRNMTCAFRYEPQFFFMVSEPPLADRAFYVQNFSNMTRYILAAPATYIDVRLSRPAGSWHFEFAKRE